MENTEKETTNEQVENIKEKTGGFVKDTKEAAEKLLHDVFGKKETVEEEKTEEEEKVDPKDIEISELKKELEELRDKYVRLYADFDNAKKRMAKDRLELIQTASKDVIKDLLPAIDDFERAIKAQESSEDIAAIKEGAKLIHTKLINTLSSKGLKAMESIGKDFDVNQHEAITEVPAPTPEQAGKVIDEIEKGYYLNEKIIRFAKVIVGK